jgi:hypothetical protein
MMDTKFTPGPWEVRYDWDEGRHIISMASAIETPGRYKSHHRIEYSHGIFDHEDEPGTAGHRQFLQAAANAHLIAAAPELYEALVRFIEDPTFQVAVGGNPNVVDRMLDHARAALAKARGEQP